MIDLPGYTRKCRDWRQVGHHQEAACIVIFGQFLEDSFRKAPTTTARRADHGSHAWDVWSRICLMMLQCDRISELPGRLSE
ncbi:hypothetical protein DDA93_12005 [Arthrobacter sp. Bz4]|nr:hypothetical protein DDA93_12005 [Arthrobacter sp. Bz4]